MKFENKIHVAKLYGNNTIWKGSLDVMDVTKDKESITITVNKDFLYKMTAKELKEVQRLVKGMRNNQDGK